MDEASIRDADATLLLSAGELVELQWSGTVSSRALLEATLRREQRLRGLNAVVTLDADRARVAADAADAAREDGESLGSLHGLPITVKDCFETAGLRTTAGALELADHVPDADAVSVARLRAAGAVIYGKTNTPTWAGNWQTTNELFGRTLNPWDLERSCGGSSGGAAVAVATGLAAVELGSDIGGSIRVPSHWTGVCGHKPTWGVVPQRGHLPGLPGTRAEEDLNVVGPLARRVADLERCLDVLAGPLPEHGVGWSLSLPPAVAEGLDGFRVGLWLDDPAFPVDSGMRGVLERAVETLGKAGAKLQKVSPDVDFRDAVRVYLELLMPLNTRTLSESAWQAIAAARSAPDPGDDLTQHGLNAHSLSHRDWLLANEARLEVRARWLETFEAVDVVVCPVNLLPAIRHDDREFPFRTLEIDGRERPYMELIAWPAIVTMAGLPATSIPVGATAAGLPVGAQFVGAPYADRTTLAFARAAESVLGGYRPPPAATGGA